MAKIYLVGCKKSTFFEADSIYSAEYSNSSAEIIRRVVFDGKHEENDSIGILSGDAYFVRHGQPLNSYFIDTQLKRYDLMLPYEEKCVEDNLQSYLKNVYSETVEYSIIIESIRRAFPELSVQISHVLDGNTYIRGNIIIAKSCMMKAFYGMIFNKMPQIADDSILVGLVLKAWIYERRLSVRSVDISYDNPEIWNAGYQKIELVRNYMQLRLKEYIELRKTEGFSDSFAGENPYSGDFDGKNPIWVCWWQGEAEMPEMVQGCIKSLRRNIPNNSTIILITIDNCFEYVTFTDTVIDKFNRGIISYTHLSDILRAELLYRYGGLWIDATYYVSNEIPENLFNRELYSIAFEEPLWGMDIMKGRWTLSLLEAVKNNPAIQFLMEGLWIYWESANELVDYFTVDYVFDTGYSFFDDIRKMVDNIAKSSAAVYELQLKMNQRIDLQDKDWLNKASLFYKLNRRNEYNRYNTFGDVTFFGYMMGEEICHNRKSIFCESYIKLVESLREINPKRVLDKDGYFLKRNQVSRGILDDVLDDNVIFIESSELIKNASAELEEILNGDKVGEGIYLIVTPNNIDYDCIIAMRD